VETKTENDRLVEQVERLNRFRSKLEISVGTHRETLLVFACAFPASGDVGVLWTSKRGYHVHAEARMPLFEIESVDDKTLEKIMRDRMQEACDLDLKDGRFRSSLSYIVASKPRRSRVGA